MFDTKASSVGLLPGERPEDAVGDADFAYELTCRELADGWVDEDRHVLPAGLEAMPAGLFLAAVVSGVDVSRLEGHDLVRVLKLVPGWLPTRRHPSWKRFLRLRLLLRLTLVLGCCVVLRRWSMRRWRLLQRWR
jgi:hypothetical protein